MSTPSNPLAAGVPALQPPKPTQAMISPDGSSVADIPVDRVQDAVKGGYKMGVDMTHPDGSTATIPVDRVHDAITTGGYKPAGSSPDAGQAMQPSLASQLAQVSGVPGLIDSAKKSWAAGQQARDEAAKAVKDSTDLIKSGDFGSAAEVLLNHIGKPLAQTAASTANNLVNGAYQNLKSNLTELDPNHGELYATPIAPGPGVSGALDNFAAEGAANAAASGASNAASVPTVGETPSIVKQVLQGKSVAQPGAVQAVRQAVQASTEAAGTADEVMANSIAESPIVKGNTTVLDKPLSALQAQEQAAYRLQDTTAGTDIKQLRDKLSITEFRIGQLTDTEEDVAQEAKLEKSRTGLMDKISEAEQKLKDAGIDPKAADALHAQRMAGEDLQKSLVKNTDPGNGSLTVDGLLKDAQKLRFSKYGDRLEQFFGSPEAADNYVSQLANMQKLGAHAVKAQTVAKWIGGLTVGGVATTAIGHALSKD